MTKIDRRKTYYMILDVETANGLDAPLVYDIGFSVIDGNGGTYEEFSYIVRDIFFSDSAESSLMSTAYYSWKIPLYVEKALNQELEIATFQHIRQHIHNLLEEYDIKRVMAHNARFDSKALNTTLRYLTNSKKRYFLPYDIEWWCTMVMAQDTICKEKGYRGWCHREPETRLTKNGRVRSTAEHIYQYISGDHDFIEEHTGLEDVRIEKKIFWACKNKHKKMRRSPWGKAHDETLKNRRLAKLNGYEEQEITKFQWIIHKNCKQQNSPIERYYNRVI